MPVEYRIHDSGIVVAHLIDVVTEQDCLYSFEYLAGPDIPRPLRVLNDARRLESYPVEYIEGSAYVQQMLSSMKRVGFTARIGYLVANDLTYGVMRRVQTLLNLDGVEIGLFRKREQILDWFELLDSSEIIP